MTRQVQEIILPVGTTYNLTSPGYPVRNYPGNIICIWKFRVPDGFRVLVNFLDFSLNRYDFLYVASRPLTGNDPPRNFVCLFVFVTRLPKGGVVTRCLLFIYLFIYYTIF